ncbi:MAG: hypothetical protein OHK0023_02480 [Anaerolineae bacterium]
MTVPKLVGIETEYGIFVQGALQSNPFTASRLVLGQCEEAGALHRRHQVKDARLREVMKAQQNIIMLPESVDLASLEAGMPLVEMLTADQPLQAETYMAAYGWDYSSLMLPNGARFYIDHAHPEYCSAETRLPRHIVAADKAGETIVERCRQRANTSGLLPAGEEIAIYKNNSDHKGNSYGCHENYLLSAGLYEDLIKRKFHKTLRALIPFLISRAIFIGAGKVGTENDLAAEGFQLTQRADFFETLIGLQTTHNRPLINTRDEAHAEKDTYRRLHVILGDANLAEYSTLLKIGTTQLILQMLEDNALHLNFTLDDPIDAYQMISRDMTFRRPLLLDSGDTVSALEMQQQYLGAAKQYLEAKASELDEEWLTAMREIVTLWEDTLEKLSRDWKLLSTRLDWAIKRNLLERYLGQQRVSWDQVALWELPLELTIDQTKASLGETADQIKVAIRHLPGVRAQYLEQYFRQHKLDYGEYWRQRDIYFTLRRLDLEYHDLRRGPDAKTTGIFYRLQSAGAVDRFLTDAEIDRYITAPPDDTRAYLRGSLIGRYGEFVSHVDWAEMSFRLPGDPKDTWLPFGDPLAFTREEIEGILNGTRDLRELIKTLRSMHPPYGSYTYYGMF